MEKVVYVLGAGFSAPLGIPVIRDFLIRAKDLYFSDRQRYECLAGVLEKIDRMQKCKSYYNIDLFNIEEILSILDMEDQVTGDDRSSEFTGFVSEVVKACTPDMTQSGLVKDEWGYLPPDESFHVKIFGDRNDIQNAYGQFVANLMSLRVDVLSTDARGQERALFLPAMIREPSTQYSVVTLNYDLVIENCIEHVRRHFPSQEGQRPLELTKPPIAKLHGSVNTRIVAPTWKKWAVDEVRRQWELAHSLLSEANHIRILGYSLPVSDSYIRYLLASAVMRSDHLKSIDVICLDDKKGTVHSRYSDFITFNFFRFKNLDLRTYLKCDLEVCPDSYAKSGANVSERGKSRWAEFTELERRHAHVMHLQ